MLLATATHAVICDARYCTAVQRVRVTRASATGFICGSTLRHWHNRSANIALPVCLTHRNSV